MDVYIVLAEKLEAMNDKSNKLQKHFCTLRYDTCGVYQRDQSGEEYLPDAHIIRGSQSIKTTRVCFFFQLSHPLRVINE